MGRSIMLLLVAAVAVLSEYVVPGAAPFMRWLLFVGVVIFLSRHIWGDT